MSKLTATGSSPRMRSANEAQGHVFKAYHPPSLHLPGSRPAPTMYADVRRQTFIPATGATVAPYMTVAMNPGFQQFRFSPEQAEQAPKARDWPDILSKMSLSAMVAINTLMLLTPTLSKRAAALYQVRKITLPPHSKQLTLLKQVADKAAFLKKLYRMNSMVGLVQLNTNYQTSINSQQPSKLLASMTYTLGSLCMILKPSVFSNIISFLGSVFWFAGERNDIENNNHPERRREWDNRQLFSRGLPPGERMTRLGEARRFIAEDLSYALSSKPWTDLWRGLRNRDDWTVPQSYQTALASQFNALAWISTVGLLGSDKSEFLKSISPSLSRIAKFGAGIAALVAYMPLTMRAWQSRTEAEGLVTLTGIPLATVSRISMASKQLSPLKGLGGIGSPLVNEGKRLNSRKYRAFVEYIQYLHKRALENPSLTAQDILNHLRTHPKEVKTLESRMGIVRVDHLESLLKTAALRYRFDRVSLAEYLYPITISATEP